MENAEEVMQLLEEFSKSKPKEIPRELEDYFGYVAKTGDPVFQWPIVRNLFREKLINVVTDFYESTLTVDLPPCPNVEPFNYERMKASLLERFDTFSSAPFTVQRICELLTNPRKEYNRADKYMRAIEKNILVVSTREPGTGKRPLECDSQTETVLNGMPDVKLSETDGSLLHIPTDLPYLGAPPASNDVTVETTEPNVNSNVSDIILNVDINGDSKRPRLDTNNKSWETQETSHSNEESEQACSTTETCNESTGDRPICDPSPTMPPEVSNLDNIVCDTNTNPQLVQDKVHPNTTKPMNDSENESSLEPNLKIQSTGNEVIDQFPDTVMVDSSQDCTEGKIGFNNKLADSPVCKKVRDDDDENEVSSTPVEGAPSNSLSLMPEELELEEPSHSEAEASNRNVQCSESKILNQDSPDSGEVSSDGIGSNEAAIPFTGEVSTKSDDINITSKPIVESPVSPNINNRNTQPENENLNLDLIEGSSASYGVKESEPTELQPDSSDEINFKNQMDLPAPADQSLKSDLCSEADSVSDSILEVSEVEKNKDSLEGSPSQSNGESLTNDNMTKDSSPSISLASISEEEVVNKTSDDTNTVITNLPEESVVTEGYSDARLEETPKLADSQNTTVVTEDMCGQEKREESVIQVLPTVADTVNEIITIEEINVDPSCEIDEEEKMDIDDSSNQMMVSEGESDGEPMDQSDQLQS